MAALPPQSSAALLRLYERYGNRLPSAVELLLVVALASSAAGLAWNLVPASGTWQPPSPAPRGVSRSATAQADAGRIAAAHLFGEFQVAADPAPTQIAEAPDTRLNLKLHGILASTPERGSRALVSSAGEPEKPYAIGDDVVPGVGLQAIFPDRIILSRAGKLETLRLDMDSPDRSRAMSQLNPRVTQAASGGSDTGLMLSTIREQVLSDPGKASEYIRIQPSSSAGQLRGYRIYPGRKREAFNALGLRPGDLVTQVNGIVLNDASTALQMLGQITEASSLTVVVERGGKQQTVNVNFN